MNMDFVLGVLFILALRFKHELLQDVVVACDDAAHMRHREHPWRCKGGGVAKAHLILSSEVDPCSVLRFVLVICRVLR